MRHPLQFPRPLGARLATVARRSPGNNAAPGSGSVFDELPLADCAWGNLVKDTQSHDGVVPGTTSLGNYGLYSGADDRLGRVAGLTSSGETDAFAAYTYVGLARHVRVAYEAAGVELTYIGTGGNAGDPYPGYDIFGNTREMKWRKILSPATILDHTKYGYDLDSRRTWREVPLAGATQQGQAFSYDNLYDQWRPLEERPGSATAPAEFAYLWGSRHRDDLVRRDGSPGGSSGSGSGSGSSGGTGRLYVAHDYFDPTCVFTEEGTVVERYGFSGFGIRRVMAPDFSDRAASAYAFAFAFHGQFEDAETGMANYGYRYYAPQLGRWIKRDPIGEEGGVNLFGFAGNDPANGNDYLGLENIVAPGNRHDIIEADYLDRAGEEIFGGREGEAFTNIGSRSSRRMAYATIGAWPHLDASLRGGAIRRLLCDSPDTTHNIIAHSAGFYNAVEGILKFAECCCKNKGGITINLLAVAPKIDPAIVREKLMEAKKACPNLKLNIRIFYDERDIKIRRLRKSPFEPSHPRNWEKGILGAPSDNAGTKPFDSFREEQISQPIDVDHFKEHGFTAALGMDLQEGGNITQQREQLKAVLVFLNQKR